MDRNIPPIPTSQTSSRSLSARRAWIEILLVYLALIRYLVALRKESVDRNNTVQIKIVKMHASLSARRAWIEIGAPTTQAGKHARRSPQGERG